MSKVTRYYAKLCQRLAADSHRIAMREIAAGNRMESRCWQRWRADDYRRARVALFALLEESTSCMT